MEEVLYTFGSEEAREINSKPKEAGKDAYSLKYVDMPWAIEVMHKYRQAKGLGNKVEITLKKEVKLRKTGTYQKIIRNMVCPWTHLTYGRFMGINPATGVPNWGAIELDEYKSFDLRDKTDAATWVILRMAPYIEGSCNSSKYFETKYWQFNDIRADNVNVVTKARDIVKITQILDGMCGSEMINLARMFSMILSPGDETTLQIIDVHGFLLQIALNDPTLFMTKYKDANRSLLELIYAGESIGVIQHSYTDGYSAMGNPIGRSIEEATSFLRSDKNLHSLLKSEIIRNDILAKRMEEQKPENLTRKEKLIIATDVPIEPDYSQRFTETIKKGTGKPENIPENILE